MPFKHIQNVFIILLTKLLNYKIISCLVVELINRHLKNINYLHVFYLSKGLPLALISVIDVCNQK